MRPVGCRRRHNRFPLRAEDRGAVEFRFPDARGQLCRMPLRDLSSAGLSMTLVHELPGLEAGSCLEGATVFVGDRRVRGDLLAMHVTPEARPGAICGALFYPLEDRDILELRSVLATLSDREEVTAAPSAASVAAE